jgi:CRP/FNR family transcriptional regulator
MTKNNYSISEYLERLFPQFDPALRSLLAESAIVKVFREDEMLIQTGQNMRSTMLIADGMVKVYRQDSEGGEFFMYHLYPGNACALSIICALRQHTSEVMARAVEKSTVILIPIALMETLMKTHKSWYTFVLETYHIRFEELLVVIDNIAFKSMDERLQLYLEKQLRNQSDNKMRLTHSQIANDLNSSREVISRLLKKMEQRGQVILHRSFIEYLK